MTYDIPAKSKLLPSIPITSPAFVYRRAKESDVRVTFARARAALEGGTRPAAASVTEAHLRAWSAAAGFSHGGGAPARTGMDRGATGETSSTPTKTGVFL